MTKRKNSRTKGKVGERDAAKFITALGFEARRGIQFKGGEDSPDVECPALAVLNLEVKREEAMADNSARMDAAMEQSRRDGGERKFPVVLWRRNRQPWRLTYACPWMGVRVTTVGNERIKRALVKLAQWQEKHNGAKPCA